MGVIDYENKHVFIDMVRCQSKPASNTTGNEDAGQLHHRRKCLLVRV